MGSSISHIFSDSSIVFNTVWLENVFKKIIFFYFFKLIYFWYFQIIIIIYIYIYIYIYYNTLKSNYYSISKHHLQLTSQLTFLCFKLTFFTEFFFSTLEFSFYYCKNILSYIFRVHELEMQLKKIVSLNF